MNELSPIAAMERFCWKTRRVFVTGAAGFVGSWLSERLVRQGARVTALIKPGKVKTRSRSFLGPKGVESVVGRVEDTLGIKRILERAGADTIFHLAANNDNLGKHVSPIPIFETNIGGAWSLLEACRQLPNVERIVFVSSSEVESTEGPPSLEAPPEVRPRRHPYPVSKLAAELIAQAYSDTYGMPIAVARSENVYGGGDLNWKRLIPGTVRSILRGETPVLRSDGMLLRDYVYVEDIVDAYMTLATRVADPDVRGQIFHFASGSRTSALDIVKYLCELAGIPLIRTITENRSANERINQEYNGEREVSLLGWSHRTELREGLRFTIEWYRKHLEDI